MVSHHDSCWRDLWESESFLENPVYKRLDPLVITSAWPSHHLIHQEPAPVLAGAEAAWDRQGETEQGSCK